MRASAAVLVVACVAAAGEPVAAARIGLEGGAVELPGVVRLIVPPWAISERVVTVRSTREVATAEGWDPSAALLPTRLVGADGVGLYATKGTELEIVASYVPRDGFLMVPHEVRVHLGARRFSRTPGGSYEAVLIIAAPAADAGIPQ